MRSKRGKRSNRKGDDQRERERERGFTGDNATDSHSLLLSLSLSLFARKSQERRAAKNHFQSEWSLLIGRERPVAHPKAGRSPADRAETLDRGQWEHSVLDMTIFGHRMLEFRGLSDGNNRFQQVRCSNKSKIDL